MTVDMTIHVCMQMPIRKTSIVTCIAHVELELVHYTSNYFGGARSKEFAMLRNVSKLTFWGQDLAGSL